MNIIFKTDCPKYCWGDIKTKIIISTVQHTEVKQCFLKLSMDKIPKNIN